jgi:hypothetical protein
MRRFFRHPTTVPVQMLDADGGARCDTLRDVSLGGLSFCYSEPLPVGDTVRVRIEVGTSTFEAPCRVVWCQAENVAWQIGVEFLDANDLFRARMIEQICHIEHYRQDVRARQRRDLSAQDAALEWIARYARLFPDLMRDR